MTTNLIDNRQIRVFNSSTFRGMQDERDYLMKRTFPEFRKVALEIRRQLFKEDDPRVIQCIENVKRINEYI